MVVHRAPPHRLNQRRFSPMRIIAMNKPSSEALKRFAEIHDAQFRSHEDKERRNEARHSNGESQVCIEV